MATPAYILNGFSWSLYMDTSATPAIPTLAQLGGRTLAGVTAIVTPITTFILPANFLGVIELPQFGPSEDATATWTQAGQRYGDQTVVQASPPKMALQFPFNPADTSVGLLTADSYNGQVDRTFVAAGKGTGTDAVYFSFVARASSYQITTSPTDVSKITLNLAMRGNLFGWSNSV